MNKAEYGNITSSPQRTVSGIGEASTGLQGSNSQDSLELKNSEVSVKSIGAPAKSRAEVYKGSSNENSLILITIFIAIVVFFVIYIAVKIIDLLQEEESYFDEKFVAEEKVKLSKKTNKRNIKKSSPNQRIKKTQMKKRRE